MDIVRTAEVKFVADTSAIDKSIDAIIERINGINGLKFTSVAKNLENSLKNIDSKVPADKIKKKLEESTKGFGDGLVKGLEKLSPRFKHFEDQVKRLGDSLTELKKTSAETGGGVEQVEKGFSGLTTGLVASASAVFLVSSAFSAASNVINTAIQSLDRAGQIEGMTAAFNNLTSSIDNVPTQKIANLDEAVGGLISTYDLMKSANQAILLGVDDGTGKFEQLAAAASKLGSAMGITTAQAVDSLTIGIGRQSKQILDNLGVMVDATKAQENFAKSLGKTVQQLTEAEKSEAWKAEAFTQIEAKAASLPPAIESASIAMQRLRATIADVSAEFVTGISSSDNLRDALNNIGITLRENETLANSLGRAIGDLAGFFIDLGGFVASVIPTFNTLEISFGRILQLSGALAPGLVNYGTELVQNAKKAQALADEQERLNRLSSESQRIASNIFGSTSDGNASGLVKALEQASNEYSKIIAAQERLASQGLGNTDFASKLAKDAEIAASRVDAFVGKLNNVNSAKIRQAGKDTEDAGNAAGNAKDKFSSLIDRINEFAGVGKVSALTDSIRAITIESQKAGDSSEQLAAKLSAMAKSIPSSQYNDFSKALSNAASEQNNFNRALENLGKSVGVVKPLTEAQQKLIQTTKDLHTEYSAGRIDSEQFEARLRDIALQAGTTADQIDAIIEKIKEYKKEQDTAVNFGDKLFGGLFGTTGKKGKNVNVDETLSDFIGFDIKKSFNEAISGLDISDDAKLQLTQNIGSALTSAWSTAIRGGSFDKTIIDSAKGIGQTFGGSIGGEIAAYVAEGFTQIGESTESTIQGIGKVIDSFFPGIGTALTESITKAFGNSNAQANARRAVADYFNQAIRKAREDFGAIHISDFFLPGGRDAFDPFVNAAGEATTRVGEYFNSLDQETRERFLGLGIAFGEVFQNSDLDSGQLGELLAANFGQGVNTLNDLQLAMQAIGLTSETTGEALAKAYESGKISSDQFLHSLAQTEDLMRQGIPGAIGAIDVAFDNVATRGNISGAQMRDAIGDIGAEAEELGIPFSQIDEHLIAMGKSTEQVEAFMAGLAEQGINTIEALKDIDLVGAAKLTESLKASGFAFEEMKDDIRTTHDELLKFYESANKKITTEWEIKRRVTGDPLPKELSSNFTGEQ